MIIVGGMGNETCLKYCVLSSNIYFLRNGSVMGNVSAIYVVLMNRASDMVMVEDHYWGWL